MRSRTNPLPTVARGKVRRLRVALKADRERIAAITGHTTTAAVMLNPSTPTLYQAIRDASLKTATARLAAAGEKLDAVPSCSVFWVTAKRRWSKQHSGGALLYTTIAMGGHAMVEVAKAEPDGLVVLDTMMAVTKHGARLDADIVTATLSAHLLGRFAERTDGAGDVAGDIAEGQAFVRCISGGARLGAHTWTTEEEKHARDGSTVLLPANPAADAFVVGTIRPLFQRMSYEGSTHRGLLLVVLDLRTFLPREWVSDPRLLQFGDTVAGLPSGALEAWFAAGLRDAFALAATDQFAPFRTVLEGALDETAAHHKLAPSPSEKARVLDLMKSLPIHPDAKEAFQAVADAGIRILALSNGAASSTDALLSAAGLDRFVERIISVEEVKLAKPRREVYLHATGLAQIEPSELALVAAHAWDVHGAKAAGLTAAFVARGNHYPAFMLMPDVIGQSLAEAAGKLVNFRDQRDHFQSRN